MRSKLTDRIAAKIERGDLPRDDCQRIDVVVTPGDVCAGCDEQLDATDGAVRCRVRDRSFVFHAQCYIVWQELLPARRPMIGWQRHPEQGASQPPPTNSTHRPG